MTTIHPAIAEHAVSDNARLQARIAELEGQLAALPQQAEPECGCCGQTGECDDDCDSRIFGRDAADHEAEPYPTQDELAVYRAVNQFGSDCHFGVESLARVWAGPKGTVERVTLKPVPELSVVPARSAQTEQQPSKAIAYRTLDRYGNPVTDWIDGDPAGGDPIVSGGSFQLAYGAPQPEQSGWVSVEDRLPEVAAGDEGEFIVCVYRSHNGESYSFSARFLNDYPLHTDYEDEPALHSGWYDVKEHADYDGWYSPLIDENSGDKVTHWMPLPAAPAMAAQGAIWERLP